MDGQRNRQTNRQTDRLIDRQTYRQTDTQIDRQTDKFIYIASINSLARVTKRFSTQIVKFL